MNGANVPARNYDSQLLWSLAVLVLFAGYFFVYRSLEDRVGTQYVATSGIVDSLRNNDAILARRPALEDLHRTLASDLRTIDLRSDRSVIVALFVRETARISVAHHVSVSAIDGVRSDNRFPVRPMPVDPSVRTLAPAANSAPLFETTPLDVILRGSYSDLLAAIRDLSRARVLAEIEVVSIERTPGASGSGASLSARLHVNLDRLNAPMRPRTPQGRSNRGIGPA